MDDNDTFKSLQLHQHQHNDNEHDDDDDDDDNNEEEQLVTVGAEFTAFQSENLDFVPSSSSSPIMLSETTDQPAELAVSSSQQQQFPTGMEETNLLCSGGIEGQVGDLKPDIFTGVTVPDAGLQTGNELACSPCPTSSALSPTSVTQSSSLTIVEERSIPNSKHNEPVTKRDHGKPSDLQAVTVVPITKTPCPDGYNWRKYGQKQVKSTKGSRSYYKCTYCDCCSKKIESSDHSGGVIETIYKGTHNHEPPRKSSINKESRPAGSAGFSVESSPTSHPIKTLNKLPSLSSIEHVQEISPLPDSKRLKLMESDRAAELIKDEQDVEPEPKQRLKKSVPACPGTIVKPDKNPKLVVHAAGDVGISSDGYRWRKYGQKMVKGNPHPRCIRNYYRCTSAGCPVRKHIETASDNTSALVIAYKGVHDHDMPVPKKRQGPPSADVVGVAAPASMSTLQIKSCEKTNQISSTQWPHDTESELSSETQNIVGMKSMEPARTLLSIGFEIKPC